jgi:hypothetical protein
MCDYFVENKPFFERDIISSCMRLIFIFKRQTMGMIGLLAAWFQWVLPMHQFMLLAKNQNL